MEIYSYWLLVNYLNHKDETRTNIDSKFEDSSEYYIHHKFWNTVEPKNDKHGSCVLHSVHFISVFVSFKVTSLALGQAYGCHKASERPSIILLNINSEFKTTLWTKASNLPQNPHTVECRYSTVQHNTILHMVWQWLMQNMHLRLYSQKTTHISPLRASYGLSFVRIGVIALYFFLWIYYISRTSTVMFEVQLAKTKWVNTMGSLDAYYILDSEEVD